jgi:hypothetical protein
MGILNFFKRCKHEMYVFKTGDLIDSEYLACRCCDLTIRDPVLIKRFKDNCPHDYKMYQGYPKDFHVCKFCKAMSIDK